MCAVCPQSWGPCYFRVLLECLGFSSCVISLFADEDKRALSPSVPTPLSSSVFPRLWAVTPLCRGCGGGLLSLVAPAGWGSLLGLLHASPGEHWSLPQCLCCRSRLSWSFCYFWGAFQVTSQQTPCPQQGVEALLCGSSPSCASSMVTQVHLWCQVHLVPRAPAPEPQPVWCPTEGAVERMMRTPVISNIASVSAW